MEAARSSCFFRLDASAASAVGSAAEALTAALIAHAADENVHSYACAALDALCSTQPHASVAAIRAGALKPLVARLKHGHHYGASQVSADCMMLGWLCRGNTALVGELFGAKFVADARRNVRFAAVFSDPSSYLIVRAAADFATFALAGDAAPEQRAATAARARAAALQPAGVPAQPAAERAAKEAARARE
jgi:hypothetical protein